MSENCSERKTEEISLLVIHNISLPPGEYGGGYIEKLFTNNLDPNDHSYFSEIYDLKVSSHLLIERDGSLVQFVPFNKKAWHAGVSSFKGRKNCNEFYIGQTQNELRVRCNDHRNNFNLQLFPEFSYIAYFFSKKNSDG